MCIEFHRRILIFGNIFLHNLDHMTSSTFLLEVFAFLLELFTEDPFCGFSMRSRLDLSHSPLKAISFPSRNERYPSKLSFTSALYLLGHFSVYVWYFAKAKLWLMNWFPWVLCRLLMTTNDNSQNKNWAMMTHCHNLKSKLLYII